jgi:hypothetical protein
MRTVLLAAALLLAAGPAQAGECSGEIMALQAQMEETPIMTNAVGSAAITGAAGGTLMQGQDTPAPTEPMDADAAAASQLNTAAGTDTTGTADSGIDAAAQALARARALDEAGDEDACMTAVDEAKGHLGL